MQLYNTSVRCKVQRDSYYTTTDVSFIYSVPDIATLRRKWTHFLLESSPTEIYVTFSTETKNVNKNKATKSTSMLVAT